MRVLVIGATGLVGAHVVQALRAAGVEADGASRRRPAGAAADHWIELDFGSLTAAQQWLPLLQGFDAVVNAVGIIRETRAGDFDRLHRAAPVALFAACEQLGLRVVQVSALGSHPQAATGYWRSKGAAEVDLLGRRMDATVIRPSLVYGDDGASSVLFRMLATLPVLMLPAAHRALVQPIHVADLADVVVRLLTTQATLPRELAVVGPRAMTMAGYLADLRRGMQAPAALVLSLPAPVARVAAHLAALAPSSAFTPESLLMLERSADGSNTADAAPAQAVLGRPLRDPVTFAGPAQRVTAAWSWGASVVTVAIALMWLITAYVSWFAWPHAESRAWLAACGVPPAWQEPVLLAASVTDAAIGVLLLLRPRRWLWAAQLVLVGGYTAMLSAFLPGFWLHPFGPLTKNLPVLALMLLMWRASPRHHQGEK
ncbi:NAD-dependent dehydratase [Duganella sp. Leaf61]|uniref:SDR family oxidoreductase n=1 Tax=Duganella sp. Leaf61 TaxID=1736227 RepID=UPI0006FB97BC|nr:SDR family oxidoreductase [Duganella sp. Leaf61]KQN76715.1 NAD-dependent dehydratase [Duganella sp. Leaf61]